MSHGKLYVKDLYGYSNIRLGFIMIANELDLNEKLKLKESITHTMMMAFWEFLEQKLQR